jgi:hypothetical protein
MSTGMGEAAKLKDLPAKHAELDGEISLLRDRG